MKDKKGSFALHS